MNKEAIELDYKAMYEQEISRRKYELEEQANYFRDEIDKEKNTKNIIIEDQLEEIEFLKNVIKGILHF